MSVDVRGSDRCEFHYYAAIQLYANYAEGLHFSAFHFSGLMFVILQLLVLFILKCVMNLISVGTMVSENVAIANFAKLSACKQ